MSFAGNSGSPKFELRFEDEAVPRPAAKWNYCILFAWSEPHEACAELAEYIEGKRGGFQRRT